MTATLALAALLLAPAKPQALPAITPPPVDATRPDTPVQKTLPNNARFVIAPTPTPGQVRAVLSASALALPDTSPLHPRGTRHLLEHLLAKGPDKLLDRRLESVGLALTAFTDRDAVTFVVSGPAEQAPLAVEALRQILAPIQTTPEEITREIAIMREEGLLNPAYFAFLDAAFEIHFPDQAPAPFGDLEALANHTPESLRDAQRRLLAPGGLTLAVYGDIVPGPLALRAEAILAPLTGPSLAATPRERDDLPATARAQAPGFGRAVAVAGLGEPLTTATVGVGLVLRDTIPGSILVYDPSSYPGAVLLAQPAPAPLPEISERDRRLLPARARRFATAWANGLLLPDDQQAALLAKLHFQAPTLRLANLRDQARGLTDDEIFTALARWQNAPTIPGSPPIQPQPQPRPHPESGPLPRPTPQNKQSRANTFPVLELPREAAPDQPVLLHIWIKAPENLSAADQAAFALLGPAMLARTSTYGPEDVARWATNAGVLPRVVAFPGFLRIELATLPETYENLVRLATAILTAPLFELEDLERVRAEAALRPTDPWSIALDPLDHDYRLATDERIRAVYARAVRPGNVRIVASGPITVGLAQPIVDDALTIWTPPSPGRPRPFADPPRTRPHTASPVAAFELVAPAFRAGEPGSQAAFLATLAIGAGKDCSTWRVLREQKGWAYRTEGLLWPTTQGVQPRFIMLRGSTAQDLDIATQIRPLLLADVETWDESTLRRAKTLARQTLDGRTPFSALFLAPGRPFSNDPVDQAAWKGFWDLLAAPTISPARFADSLQSVTLPDLKAAARQLLDQARVQILPARPTP